MARCWCASASGRRNERLWRFVLGFALDRFRQAFDDFAGFASLGALCAVACAIRRALLLAFQLFFLLAFLLKLFLPLFVREIGLCHDMILRLRPAGSH